MTTRPPLSSSSATSSNGTNTKRKNDMEISETEAQVRLDMIRRYVAKPIPTDPSWTDPEPALISNSNILIGNKYHAANVSRLLSLGVTAVLNCASGGISRLPVDELKKSGIRYAFTNVRQDNYTYPILHDHTTGECSKHLEVAKALYSDVVYNSTTTNNNNDHINHASTGSGDGGKVLFFCVAGQNRSATLAIAVLMLFGHSLERILESCAKTRPFILENIGFQRQLVELEAKLMKIAKKRMLNPKHTILKYSYGNLPIDSTISDDVEVMHDIASPKQECVEIELLIPGYCTMEVMIPVESTVATVKQCLIDHANKHLLSYENEIIKASPTKNTAKTKKIAKSWVVLAMFGYDDMYDVPLEVEATELSAQLERMRKMFGLTVTKQKLPHHSNKHQYMVRWNEKCRFALVIFSVYVTLKDGTIIQEPWTFVHEERPGAPATLLENTLLSTHLRAWDFVTGQAFCSKEPVVFSFANDSRDKRAFMKISTSAKKAQQFQEPGEGGILGMGANAIVHRVQLKPTSADPDAEVDEETSELSAGEGWDAAVKRPFSLSKMLASLENSSEAGLAKRMRFANSLNSDGRVLYFYGLGVGLAANAMDQTEYKFEATLLARYEEEFSSYTMRRFMEDYIAIPPTAQQQGYMMDNDVSTISTGSGRNLVYLQSNFTLISVKVLLVSLLNAFRDLTLMGICAFDFNHLNNVLVSHDLRTVRLIDIDGNSQGSIQYPSEYMDGYPQRRTYNMKNRSGMPHKPSLDIDLNTVLPRVVQQLILGKGRGPSFVSNKVGDIWRAPPDTAKAMIREVIRANFFATTNHNQTNRRHHSESDNPNGYIQQTVTGIGTPTLSSSAGARMVAAATATTTTGVVVSSTSTTSNSNSMEEEQEEEEEEDIVMEDLTNEDAKRSKHIAKVAEWFYAMLKKQSPWDNWTNDIYDAMRCIDHLPIT